MFFHRKMLVFKKALSFYYSKNTTFFYFVSLFYQRYLFTDYHAVKKRH